VPPFWLSIGLLSLVQGALVALAGDGAPLRIPWVERRRGRLWAAVPPLSVILFVFIARAATTASADSLTYLALVAVPLLAALALGVLMRGARPVLALAVLLAAVTPPRWLATGIVLMACADAALVLSELLQHPNEALNAAHPAAGLPRLQAAVFGSAEMGYGDLFVAGVLGGLLARRAGTAWAARGAVLVVALAVAFDLLFFAVNELPATVPVAGALLVLAIARRQVAHPAHGEHTPAAVPGAPGTRS